MGLLVWVLFAQPSFDHFFVEDTKRASPDFVGDPGACVGFGDDLDEAASTTNFSRNRNKSRARAKSGGGGMAHPSSLPVDTQPYGMSLRSLPSFFQILSMMRNSCSVRRSCRKSSPSLKRAKKLGHPASPFSNSSHSGTFFELIDRHPSTTSPLHFHRGLSGKVNSLGSSIARSCSLMTSGLRLLLVSFTAAATEMSFSITSFCLSSSRR